VYGWGGGRLAFKVVNAVVVDTQRAVTEANATERLRATVALLRRVL